MGIERVKCIFYFDCPYDGMKCQDCPDYKKSREEQMRKFHKEKEQRKANIHRLVVEGLRRAFKKGGAE